MEDDDDRRRAATTSAGTDGTDVRSSTIDGEGSETAIQSSSTPGPPRRPMVMPRFRNPYASRAGVGGGGTTTAAVGVGVGVVGVGAGVGVAAGGVKRRRVVHRNPYAAASASAGGVGGSVVGGAGSSSTGVTDTPSSHHPDAETAPMTADSTVTGRRMADTTTTTTTTNGRSEEEEEEVGRGTTGVANRPPPAPPPPHAKVNPAPSSSSSSSFISVVDRLPSRNVTYRSAEIVTVTELHDFITRYHHRRIRNSSSNDNVAEGKVENEIGVGVISVRVTGVILRHLVDTNVIELGDPTTGARPPGALRSATTKTPMRSRVVPSAAAGVNSGGVQRRTLGPARRTTTGGGGGGVGLLGIKGTLMSGGARPVSGGGGSGGGSTVKRRTVVARPLKSSSSSNKLSPVNRTTGFKPPSTIPVVRVDVESALPMMGGCTVGDLLMVIGEIDLSPPPPPPPTVTTEGGGDVSTSHTPTIVARIARCANGTDMNLQREAILLRRKHLSERRRRPRCDEVEVGCGDERIMETGCGLEALVSHLTNASGDGDGGGDRGEGTAAATMAHQSSSSSVPR